MSDESGTDERSSFLGTGWSFPPRFSRGRIVMQSGEDDIHESLAILFQTVAGERLLHADYGLDLQELLFEPLTTTLLTYLADRISTVILIHEPRVQVLNIEVQNPSPQEGSLRIRLEYQIRATNSRFNKVFPFYRSDGHESIPPG